MGGDDLADQARADGFAHPGQMRGPTAILVDGKLHAVLAGKGNKAAAFGEVEDEGLLRQDVLACLQRGFEDRQAVGGVGGDVDYVDAWVGQDILPAVGDVGPRGEFDCFGLRFPDGAVADRCHLPARRAVGVEMGGDDAARADHADPGAVGARHWRLVGQGRGRNLGQRGGFQGIGVGVGLAHGISGRVRF